MLRYALKINANKQALIFLSTPLDIYIQEIAREQKTERAEKKTCLVITRKKIAFPLPMSSLRTSKLLLEIYPRLQRLYFALGS